MGRNVIPIALAAILACPAAVADTPYEFHCGNSSQPVNTYCTVKAPGLDVAILENIVRVRENDGRYNVDIGVECVLIERLSPPAFLWLSRRTHSATTDPVEAGKFCPYQRPGP